MNSEQNEDLTIGKFRFANDDKGNLIPVPSDLDLQGFVGHENVQSEFARIQIPTSSDPEDQRKYLELWDTVFQARNTSAFAEIIDCGEDDGIPFYVSKFPHGEPLSIYLEDSPPWPGKLAARVIGKFIASLRFQKEIPINLYNISYQSLWVEKTIYGPRLLIGDVSLDRGQTSSAYNGALMLSVFKELTKEERPEPAITDLFKKLSQGPMSLGLVEKALKQFSLTGDSRKVEWTAESEPTPWLETCLAKVDLVSKQNLIETKDLVAGNKTVVGLGKYVANQSIYRSAIELDPSSQTIQIPRRTIAMWSTATLIVLLFGFFAFTSPGKAVFEGITGLIGGYTYEPTLVLPPRPDDTASKTQEDSGRVEKSVIELDKSPTPISLNGTLMDADGIVNGSFQPIENSINTFSSN